MTPENIRDLKKVIHETIEENPSIITLKSDVAGLKSDVAGLKSDVARIDSKMDQFNEQLFETRATVDEMQRDIKLILDAVIPAKARATQIDQVVEKVDHHEYRIGAIETWITDRGTETPKN